MNFAVTETNQGNMDWKKWRCTKNACKAFVRTDAGCKTVVPKNIEHISNHTADEH